MTTGLPNELNDFPIRLGQPWGAGWETEIVFWLAEGGRVVLAGDGHELRVADEPGPEPFCTVRCTRDQLRRLLTGASAVRLLFEGLEVDRFTELLALQSVLHHARRREGATVAAHR